MNNQAGAFRAALRIHLSAFIHRTFREVSPAADVEMSWYMQAIAYHLELCAERKITRLIINIPPRYGKSISASVAFVAWLLGRNPQERIVCVSYSAELAHRFARDTRSVMSSDWYRRVFPGTRVGERNAIHDFRTTKRGYRYTTSVDGTLTGVGGTVFLLDDPNPASDEHSAAMRANVVDWYQGTLRGRLDDAHKGVIIVIQQRIHSDDLSGYLLESDGEDWVHLNLPAIATQDERIPIGPDRWHHRRVGDVLDPAREGLAQLERRRRSMTSQTFSAQFQQDPVPDDGEVVQWRWFLRYRESPPVEAGDTFVQSWDTASKAGELNDFSVCTTWLMKGRDYYLLDVWRARANFPELKRAVYAQAARWGADVVLIEDKGSGTSLIAQLLEEDDPALPRPIARDPKLDKVTRMSAASDRIEQGHVHIPIEASWLATFRSEMLQFPKGKHDDQVDSVSQFLDWAFDRDQYSLILTTYRT